MEHSMRHQNLNLPEQSQDGVSKFCLPCNTEGKRVPFHGFCQTCKHYLCAACFKVHTVPLPCKNHVLLDKSYNPKDKTSKVKPGPVTHNCTIPCPDHHDKVVEFYCSAHNEVVCSVCAIQKHKSCNVDYIPDVAKDYKNSQEYNALVDKLNEFQTRITTLSEDITENVSSVQESAKTTLEEIYKFRREINEYLDRKEQKVKLATQAFVKKDSSLLKNLIVATDKIKTELSNMIRQFKSTENAVCDLFVNSKQVMKDLDSLSDRFNQCVEKNKTVRYSFERGQNHLGLLTSDAELGSVERICWADRANFSKQSVVKETPNIDFHSVSIQTFPDIKAKVREDETKSWITGFACLSPGRLLLVDNKNYSMKALNEVSNTIVAYLTFSSAPWDVTVLPSKQVAVSFPDTSEIQIISTEDAFSVERVIAVKGECLGIDSTLDRLVVSYQNPGKVEVMDFNGKVHACVRKDSEGSALLNLRYVSVAEEARGPVIYTSSYGTNSVTKVSLSGKVLDTFTHQSCDGIIATGNGQLLVCSVMNHCVDVVSDNGKKIKKLLKESHKIEFPQALCYSADTNTLYVSSMMPGKRLKVFKLTKK